MIGTLTLVAFYIGLFRYSNLDIGRTMAFCVLSISQLVHSLNVRSNHSIFLTPKNLLLSAAIILGILLQVLVVISPLFSSWFSTANLNAEQWKVTAILCILPLIIVEFSKLFVRNKKTF